ncbi:fungal-specific transcription factor domain-containing protein [Aspergillus minisclerotigenes]|uniref:Fungal-specific transcription factor domain-containing protein n=1 Tax=Aspergillus minisclerotigenes TaxID=656917 RepID=A0A5N6JEI2_9EURO|nr:fungal-specific transcription factor domain-containing protein [Aspergillus minisclerotigenes]
MEASGPLGGSQRFARYACDHCRQKKLKCSRERPKCSICKPWPGGCHYSREMSSSSQPSINRVPETYTVIEARLRDLEFTVQRLTNSVDRALQTILSAPPKPADPQILTGPSQSASASVNVSNSDLYIGSSHSFSFLRETPAKIDAIPRLSSDETRQSAYSELRYLSDRLATGQMNQNDMGDTPHFYVPSRPAGYRLISKFWELAEVAEPFFSAPTDEVVRHVVFEPHKVRESGWVVYFNFLILSDISPRDDNGKEAERLRCNLQLALNDSCIFLEPREVNVQALTLLSMHGEDYATPNLSWMILGHACRQAEALGLHASNHPSAEVRQKRLCLFWLLFVMDKSCSLAFGRPAFLPTAVYQNIPLPDDDVLLRFHPRDGEENAQNVSRFGAQLFKRSVDLSKLTGLILDALPTGDSLLARRDIRFKLDHWYQGTVQALTETKNAESATANPNHLREMTLGINSINLHYLHILVILLKGDESNSALRLSSARDAISLLHSMVSNWSSIYNGVVWHLLYYPFTPFFVIFENIVHHTCWTPAVEQDLQLLSATMSYYAEMRSQMRLLATVCARLQRVAATFLRLAQVHVRQYASVQVANDMETSTESRRLSQAGCYGGSAYSDREVNGLASTQAKDSGTFPDVDVEEPDVATYLEWLPADLNLTWPVSDVERQDPNSQPGAGDRGTSRNASRKAFDSVFDWFSWDAYYAEVEG